MPSVDDSIQFVKGIGPKKAKLLEKLHIRTLRDALETYPRDYEDRTHITPIAEIDMEVHMPTAVSLNVLQTVRL